jgi:hypothetical protein
VNCGTEYFPLPLAGGGKDEGRPLDLSLTSILSPEERGGRIGATFTEPGDDSIKPKFHSPGSGKGMMELIDAVFQGTRPVRNGAF